MSGNSSYRKTLVKDRLVSSRFTLWLIPRFVAIIAALIAVLVPVQSQAGSALVRTETPRPLATGWFYLWSQDESTITVPPLDSDERWKILTSPDKPLRNQTDATLWLRVTIPATSIPEPTLHIERIFSQVTFFENGEKTATYGTTERYPGFPPHFVRLNNPEQPTTLHFQVRSQYSNVGFRGMPRLGSRSAHIERLLLIEGDMLFLGFLFILSGFVGIFLFSRYRAVSGYLHFGLLAICLGVYTLGGCQLRLFIYPNPRIWGLVGVALLFFAPYFFARYHIAIFGSGRWGILRRAAQVHGVFAAGALIAAAVSPLGLLHFLLPFDAILAITAPMFVVHAAILARRDLVARILLAGFVALLLALTHDILREIRVLHIAERLFTSWGVFGFLFSLMLVQGRRFAETHRQVDRYAKDLEQKNIRLSQLDRLKDEFLANTSHELRTPLNGIVGLADSMLMGAGGRVSAAHADNLRLIASSGRRLASLVDQILDFGKMKRSQIELAVRPVAIQRLADNVLSSLKSIHERKQLFVINDIPLDFPLLAADENRMLQILFNLIGNAFKFTERGRVRLHGAIEGDRAIVSVSDTGIGIEPSHLVQIFEAFEQGDGSTARRFGGTGLGLAITKQMIELHGGMIWVESTPGKGSTFSFSIPIAGCQNVSDETSVIDSQDSLATSLSLSDDSMMDSGQPFERPQEHEAEELQPSTQTYRHTVLVVDDEAVNVQVLVNYLDLQGFEIETALSGEDALAHLHSDRHFDLVLLDIMMPGLSGYEVCREIRKNWTINQMPIIFLTAKNQTVDMLEGFSCGGNDFVVKPFSRAELFARIDTHLFICDLTRALAQSRVRLEILLHSSQDLSKARERTQIIANATWGLIRGMRLSCNLALTFFLPSLDETEKLVFIGYQAQIGTGADEILITAIDNLNQTEPQNIVEQAIANGTDVEGVLCNLDTSRCAFVFGPRRAPTLIVVLPRLPLLDGPESKDLLDFLRTLALSVEQSLRTIEYVEERMHHAAVQVELEAAKAVQEALLPQVVDLPCFEIAAFYQSATQTSGDWYGYRFDEDSQKLYLFVGDVVGHGFPSAILTGVAAGVTAAWHKLRDKSLADSDELVQLAEVLNHVLCGLGNGRKSMSMALLSIDAATGVVQLVNAGHEWPRVISTDGHTQRTLNARGPLLGIFDDASYTGKSFRLQPQETLILYTDGLIESPVSWSKGGSKKRLFCEVISKHGHNDPRILVQSLAEASRADWGYRTPDDDVSILAVRWLGSAFCSALDQSS